MFIKDTKYDILVKIFFCLFELNRIGNVMVGVLASKAVDCGFEVSIGSKQTLSNWYFFDFSLDTQRVGLVQSGHHHLILTKI
jgi:hypothetical protein